MGYPRVAPKTPFGARVREARDAQGWTIAELGERVGTSDKNISGIERGKHKPRWDLVVKLADVLDVSLDWLAHGLTPEQMVRRLFERQERARIARDIAAQLRNPAIPLLPSVVTKLLAGQKKDCDEG